MRSYRKDIRRLIRKTIGRFFSIAIISMLSVGLFVGLRSTEPDMRLTAHDYYQDRHLMDAQIVSTLGFSDKDIEALRQEGLTLDPGYQFDALGLIEGREGERNLRLYAYDEPAQVNRLTLREGRVAQYVGECAVDYRFAAERGLALGDRIALHTGDDEPITDTLRADKLKIVGIVESPLYISFEYGNSSVGSGRTDGILFVPSTTFNVEVYTSVFLEMQGARALDSGTQTYRDYVDAQIDRLEQIADRREPERYQEITDEGYEKLADAEAELADGERERDEKIADAQQTIDDAWKEIEEGEADLAEGKATLERELAEGRQELADARQELEDGQAELTEKEAELADGERKIAEARVELEDGKERISEGRGELSAGRSRLQEAKTQLDGAKTQLDDAKAQLDALGGQLEQMPQDNPAYDAMKEQYVQNTAQYEENYAQYEAGYEQYQQGSSALSRGEKKLSEASARLESGGQRLTRQEKEIEDGKVQIREGWQELFDGWNRYGEGLAELERGEREGRREIAEGEKELEEAKIKLADGERELAEQEAESARTIADAREKIADARQDLEELEQPEWHFFTRQDLPAHAEYFDSAQRVAAIGVVFPMVFFAVALLISLTTMSRMVDEQRAVIGTFKMLGYSKAAITLKYVLYAALASSLGCVFGLALGRYFFPPFIAYAYSIKFAFPPLVLVFQWESALLATGMTVFLIVFAAWWACRGELRGAPAGLLRPRAPKAGRRILLERIEPLWRRTPFSWKVTLRNIFRYKARFLMTILGVAGCTALMLTGFGLKDSISAVPVHQFTDIRHEDLVVVVDDEALEGGREALWEDVAPYVTGGAWWQQLSMSVEADGGSHKLDAGVIVPEDEAAFAQVMTLRTYQAHEPLALAPDGVIVTYKIGSLLGVSPGDTIALYDSDNARYDVRVTGIAENYIDHYVIMAPALYESLTDEAFSPNMAGLFLAEAASAGTPPLEELLTAREGVLTQVFTADTYATISEMFTQLDTVVLILIGMAGILALVVLFNLNTINIAERTRELATIKVLGFLRHEVATYILRESMLLSVLGTATGCILGISLHRFVILTAEVDMVMFGRDIASVSFAISAALTVAFAGIVFVALLPKLARIDMVESLKSVE